MIELVIILGIGFVIMTILWRKTTGIVQITADKSYSQGYQTGFWTGFNNGGINKNRIIFENQKLYILPVCSLASEPPILECYFCEYSEVCSRVEI